nr:putative neugrin-like protein DDB_G0288135 [Vanessa tameamea]
MSLKNAKPEKKKPRAMPVETIVTRFKSAQQKRLLEKEQTKPTAKSKNINSCKKSKTNLKKVTSTEKKSPRHKKVKKSEENVNTKIIEEPQIENKEYYPNKLKRKVLNARRFLAPKPNCKVICGTKSVNKRKLHTPQRDMKYVTEQTKAQCVMDSDKPKQKAQSPELSITDMVRIIEENGSLDEEDLLEILTCPSPVWWEEPPDGYIEEALFSQDRPEKTISVKNQIKEEQKKDVERKRNKEDKHELNNNSDKTDLPESLDINIDSRDKSFINKRCKLETLLGIIKNKGVKPLINKNNSNKNESDPVNNNENESPKVKIKEEVTEHLEVKETIEEVNTKRNSECTDEELIEFRDDEILRHLENLEIPIEASVKNNDSEENEDVIEHTQTRRISIESNTSDKNMSAEYLDLSLLDDDEADNRLYASKTIKTESTLDELKQENDESEYSNDPSDRIPRLQNDYSKTNDRGEDNNDKTVSTDDYNTKIYKKKLDNEFVTVYKIINNDIFNEMDEPDRHTSVDIDKIKDTKDMIDRKINSYYKQCKKIPTLKLKLVKASTDKCNRYTSKAITISDSDNVKYCFICSSIFDSEKCNYCLRKTLKRKLNEYSCDVCGLIVKTKHEMIKHLSTHI